MLCSPVLGGKQGITGAGFMLNGAGSILWPELAPLEVLGRPKCGAGPAPVLEPAPLTSEPAPHVSGTCAIAVME